MGAPYEGDGAVYNFRGAAHGIVKEYSQRIYAGDLQTARPLTTFGYSLSGGIDMDNNYYKDLAVGAYKADKLVVLRARPVINIQAVILSIPEKIQPDVQQCPPTGQRNGCFHIRLCFQFTAEPTERYVGLPTRQHLIIAQNTQMARIACLYATIYRIITRNLPALM